jgi:hypothetical protein
MPASQVGQVAVYQCQCWLGQILQNMPQTTGSQTESRNLWLWRSYDQSEWPVRYLSNVGPAEMTMTGPTFDADGYPTEDTLDAITSWPHQDVNGCLDFCRQAWHWPDFTSDVLTPCEASVLHAEKYERHVRFATGGWSGNEAIIGALQANQMVNALCWRLSAVGGLHIFRYRP